MALSRIVATVTTVRPVASVQVQGANTVNTTSISAGVSVQRVVPLAAINWISIVMGAEVDYRGMNPVIHEINVVTDASRLLVGKRFFDSSATSDSYTLLVFKKAAVETLHPVDVKTFSLQRQISESLHSQDDFNASVPTDDGEVMTFGKHVPDDAVTKSDVEHMAFGKRSNETVASVDVRSHSLSKPLSDAKSVSDVRVNQIDKPLSDTVDAGDEMNAQAITDDGEIMVFGKTTSDYHEVADEAIVEAGKNLSDSIGSSDELLPFELGKGINEPVATSEIRSVDLVRGAIEDFPLTWDYSVASIQKPISDRVYYPADGPNQYNTYALSYFLEDYAFEGFPALDVYKALTELKFATDLKTFTLSKPFADAFVNADSSLLLVAKSASDAVAQSDLYVPLFGKNPADSIASSDTRTKFFGKAFSDTVTSTDDFYGIANADDDETMLYGKNTAEQLWSSDQTTSFVGKSLVDSATKSDLKTFDLEKVKSDSVSKSDAATKLSGKAIDDTFSKSDANTIFVGKSNADSASATESQVRSVSKALSDTTTKSDSATRDNAKALSDTFSKSDSTSRAVGKGLDDAATTGETKAFSISKSLADTVHPTDAYQHIAVSDDDENMLFGKISNDIVLKSDSNTIAAGKALADSVSKSDSGSLVWTDYWDINYTVTSSGVYVGNSQSF